MPVTTRLYGELETGPVAAFRIEDGEGLAAEVIEYGATLTRLVVPDRNGVGADIVLGFDRLEGYLSTRTYFGATAGRYANRIAAARFSLDGATYQLGRNDGRNHLHGGVAGFDKMHWKGEADAARNAVRL